MAINSKITPELLSLAAAHGLRPSVWQSWNPRLVRTPRVLVPIELQVLMVRNPEQRWADCGMKTPPPANDGVDPPVDAATLTPPPFAELPTPRPRGAYLQWYLPRGLTAGTASTGPDQAKFPPIPDRWLVLRISQGSTRLRRAVTGWVLQADGEPPVVRKLTDWSEPGLASGIQKPLTALGHGDLSWAGYFDNVQNRLGFYDGTLSAAGQPGVDGAQALNGVQGPIAYLVCGWYADAASDPLGAAHITSLAAFNATMTAMGWELDAGQLDEVTRKRGAYFDVLGRLGLQTVESSPHAAYTTAGNWWPTATVFHGAVVDIDWPGSNDSTEFGGPPDAAAVVVAAGNTMAETLASLVARANSAPGEAPIVEALQLGVLSELDQPDGRAQLDSQLHATSFAGRSGGDAATEPVTIAPSGPPPSPPANPGTPKPGIFGQPQPSQGGAAALSGDLARDTTNRLQLAAPRPPGQLSVADGRPRSEVTERFIVGGLQSVIQTLGAGVTIPPTDPGGDFDALRALPRYYTPKDPVVLIQGGKRAFTHDSGVKTENGQVICRLTPVTALTWSMPERAERFLVTGDDVLENDIGNGSVPLECEGLLRETLLLDTGSAAAMAAGAAARTAENFDIAAAGQRVAVEQTTWYALRNPRIDAAPLLARSGIAGTLPAPFAVAPASRPWTPIHLDWQVEFLPSPGGETDWTLGELDFSVSSDAAVPRAGSGTLWSGRATVTGGAAATLASAVTKAVDDVTRIAGTGQVPVKGIERHFSELSQSLSLSMRELTLVSVAAPQAGTPPRGAAPPAAAANGDAVDPSLLNDIGSALAQMDVLSCGLNGLLTQLRAGIPADGHATAPDGVTPAGFVAVRAGFLRLVRLRLVDGFGQFVDLCGSDATHDAAGYLVSDPASVPEQPGWLAQPPRFTAPTRIWFRYMSADQPTVEADHQVSPVCGFLMPNHLDGALEFFNADGSGAGVLQPDENGLVTWAAAPGLPSTAGQDPALTLTNGHTAQLANSLIDWGVEDVSQSREAALAALLRIIDSTLWTVDPFGHQGDEHLSLLVGHPICVMRGLLRLDVADPVVSADGTLAKVPVRLGNLTQWQDGLLGYFVNDDYTTLYAADAAAAGMARPLGPQQGFLQQINLVPNYYTTFSDDVAGNVTDDMATPGATPVSHPYVDTSGLLWIRPDQTITLTLLVEPLTTVHATAGRVPRKEIGMRRGWVNAGLAAIAPTFRFGPVLVDPKQIRMPLATDLSGTWVWDHRADAVAWKEDAVTNATDDALLGADPPTGSEGWLKLLPPKPAPTS